ncbi:DUF2157 domain-containing protein [Sphingobacterium faecale]|uniref:DUF2157 domain-containing protein n=1 Tax=Sphingobacterium faecale TaxID=2803775 RepID=A0ABS1QXP1_9SPHI|nr:DUF2157 domain-containing protein [Sphingobacterium faecale]MBL1407187.1 DUF2157 domain-containing protein [Sphingobacterium faecale]
MDNIQREDIESIARQTSLSEETLTRALNERVYPDANSWKKFLTLLFLVLGIGFSLAGIIFFFAYNWADLHKFAKIGIVELLVIALTALTFLSKINTQSQQIILTGSAVLVGVLFAVFGQIYQTGANAYDFFLGWTVFVTLWVCFSNFAPMWLLYMILLNTTLILYCQQVTGWPSLLMYGILYLGNGAVFVLAKMRQAPAYFIHTVGLAALTFATIGMINGIVSFEKEYFSVFAPLVILTYLAALWHGVQTKSTFYLSAVPFSLIIIISTFLLDISNDEWMLLLIGVFIIISVTLVVRNLIQLAKKQSS